MPKKSFFTVGRRVGLVFLLLVGLLVAVYAAVLSNLHAIRVDADQLLEETREASSSTQLAVQLESLVAQLELLRASPQPTAAAQASVRHRLDALHAAVRAVHEHPDGDPSRAEHQVVEVRLLGTILGDLEQAAAALDGELGSRDPAIDEALQRGRRYADALASETRAEAERANQDLDRRADRTVSVMIWTAAAVVAALGAALWIVSRTVVRPIRALQVRAERLGRGEFGLPVTPHRRDEIGDLSRSFDRMAERLAAARGELETKIAERTREFVRAARFADIGVLAAGVAHEINNPLASIASCAEGLQRRIARGDVDADEKLDYLRTITSEAYRAREITGQLLRLARPERGPAGSVELDALLQQVVLMTRHQLEDRGVKLVVETEPTAPELRGAAGELLQVLVNLVLNAKDASPLGGTVHLRTASGADLLDIHVDDEGPGVPAELAPHVFDPFVTTKEPGEGTGLGLALAASIVETHGGSITIARAPSGGARFTVHLPLGAADRP